MKATLTIFTPAYNRAYTLHKCYESLKKQTNKDFEWLIIDDGSTDNTRQLVQSWIEENIIPIKYHYQKNQGMHGAHNTAYELIDTELNVCIDSDDYMPDDAVEKILKFWDKNKSDNIAGIVLGLVRISLTVSIAALVAASLNPVSFLKSSLLRL